MREPHPVPTPAPLAEAAHRPAANDVAFRVVDHGWWLGPWEPYQAGAAWQLRRRSACAAGWIDFHGGNARPLCLGEGDAAALAAALNRRGAAVQARLAATPV